MNLINDLNNGVVSNNNLIKSFYKKVNSEIADTSPSEEEFLRLTSQPKFKYITYDEYCNLVELKRDIKNFKMKRNILETIDRERKMEMLMNKYLVRALANDMCADDCEHITDNNYMLLGQLEYECGDDSFIPELVRKNFVLFAKRDYLRRQIESCCEVVDRLNLSLGETLGTIIDEDGNLVKFSSPENSQNQTKENTGNINKVKPSAFNKNYARLYYKQLSLPNIQSRIGKYRCPKLSDEDMTALLFDYDDKVFHRLANSNKLIKKSKDEIIEDLMTEQPKEELSLDEVIMQAEKSYDELGLTAFNPKDEKNALIKSGYENFRLIKVFENIKDKKLKHIRMVYDEVRTRLPKTKQFFDEEEQTPTDMYRNTMRAGYESSPLKGAYAEIDYLFCKLLYMRDKTEEMLKIFQEAKDYRDKCREMPSNNWEYPDKVSGMKNIDVDK